MAGPIGEPTPVPKVVPRRTRIRTEDFAEDYVIFRSRGWTHAEIAMVYGYTIRTVHKKVNRARLKGLLPRPVSCDFNDFRIRARHLNLSAGAA